MDISKRKCYGYGDGGDCNGDDGSCPACGCLHMEAVKIAANKDSITFRVTCRYCGWQTLRTFSIDVATEQ